MNQANCRPASGRHSLRTLLALLAPALLLASCGSEEPAAGSDAASGTAGSTEYSTELGSVNLPRPDWLPGDFPLPDDTHIYLVSSNPDTTPAMFQLQARTLADRDGYTDDVMRWAEARGLHPRDEGQSDVVDSAYRIMSFDGVEFSPSNMQVSDQGGEYRQIVLTVVGPPWD